MSASNGAVDLTENGQYCGSAIAALPMFDLVELTAHTDTLWRYWAQSLAGHGVVSPSILTRPVGALINHWRDPRVLITQTCGYPYRVGLADSVGLIGTFAYDICEEGKPGVYRSVLVANDKNRERELSTFAWARTAINSRDSLSGCVSLGVALHRAKVGTLKTVIESGGHVNSLSMLRAQQVDLAAIDWLTWSLLSDVRPEALVGLSIIARGPEIPCPPLITADPSNVPVLRAALVDALTAIEKNSPETLRALRITGFHPREIDDYTPIIALGKEAAEVAPMVIEVD
jgi:ABC-type phosphate/phosphonate transport system substrate-binding protein